MLWPGYPQLSSTFTLRGTAASLLWPSWQLSLLDFLVSVPWPWSLFISYGSSRKWRKNINLRRMLASSGWVPRLAIVTMCHKAKKGIIETRLISGLLSAVDDVFCIHECPLMRIEHTSCLRSKMSQRHWSQYVHRASAIFAWFISRGELVTVLSPPPPERFHPSGHTSYQEIEEPIVTGQVGQSAVAQIIIVHPTIKGGEEFFYELWPVDRGSTWVENFGLQSATRRWRRTRQCDDRRLRELAALRDQSWPTSTFSWLLWFLYGQKG